MKLSRKKIEHLKNDTLTNKQKNIISKKVDSLKKNKIIRK